MSRAGVNSGEFQAYTMHAKKWSVPSVVRNTPCKTRKCAYHGCELNMWSCKSWCFSILLSPRLRHGFGSEFPFRRLKHFLHCLHRAVTNERCKWIHRVNHSKCPGLRMLIQMFNACHLAHLYCYLVGILSLKSLWSVAPKAKMNCVWCHLILKIKYICKTNTHTYYVYNVPWWKTDVHAIIMVLGNIVNSKALAQRPHLPSLWVVSTLSQPIKAGLRPTTSVWHSRQEQRQQETERPTLWRSHPHTVFSIL